MAMKNFFNDTKKVLREPPYILAASIILAIAFVGTQIAGHAQGEKKEPAAIIQKIAKEESFNAITLSQKTAERLGITVKPIEKKSVQKFRLYSGEIITPVGRRGVVTAPFGGILKAPPTGLPKAGDTVKKGQTIFILLPVLTPEARSATATTQVDADMQAQNTTTQLQAAKIALDRARNLYNEGVGAKRAVDEAQAIYDTAAKTKEAANERQKLLEESLNEGTAAPIMIAAPEDGILTKVSAAHGQNVPGGTVLFAMGDLSTAWVRVTIPVGDLEDIARDGDAQVGSLSASSAEATQTAMPVSAPPLANPLAFTMDLLYVLHNSGEEAIPGKRVGVLTPVKVSTDSLVVPSGAIVYDALGGSWIYEETAPLTYNRKRVTVSYNTDKEAVLSSSPAEGTSVVTIGAQALFGAETGTMK